MFQFTLQYTIQQCTIGLLSSRKKKRNRFLGATQRKKSSLLFVFLLSSVSWDLHFCVVGPPKETSHCSTRSSELLSFIHMPLESYTWRLVWNMQKPDIDNTKGLSTRRLLMLLAHPSWIQEMNRANIGVVVVVLISYEKVFNISVKG